MKSYMPPIVVLVILAALVGGGLLTANMLKSPEAAFTREVDQKVEQAQRLLMQYEGGQPALVVALEGLSKAKPAGGGGPSEPSTQPAAAVAADEVTAGGGRDYLTEQKGELERKRQELNDRLVALGAEQKTAPEFGSLEELNQRIRDNADLLDKALELVRDAINTAGTNELSGTSHPVATRLEAQLLYQKADLARRRANVYRVRSGAERDVLDRVLLAMRQADNAVEAIQRELNGTAGETIGGKDEGPAAAQKPKAKEAGEPTKEPSEPASEPAEPPASDNEADKPAEEPKPAVEAGPVVIAAVPSIEDRIKQLQAQGTEVDGQIAEARKEVDRLSAAVKSLREDLAAVRARSDDAQKRMMELVNAGVDAVDPDAMPQFVEEYGRAARADREAAREAAALQAGMMRNAKPDAEEENEILTAPLVPADGSGKIEESLGLTALEADLRASEALVTTRQDLRKLIDAQIKALQTRRDDLTAELAKAQAWKAGLAQEVAGRVKSASEAAGEALKLEKEALDILAQGQTAANQAQSAAQKWSSDVAEFHRKNAAPTPQTGYLGAHAEAVAADIEMQRALVLAQQAEGLRQQEVLLGRVSPLLSVAAPTTQPGEASAPTASAACKDAIAAAKAALEKYKSAADKLGGLWTLHAQMAAAHYLLGTLQTGDEAQKERAESLKAYQSATRDRGELGRQYRPMIQALSAQ